MKQELIDRLVRYVKVDTQSNLDNSTCPSTEGQLELAKMLVDELKEIGMSDVTIDENGYVMATLSSNIEEDVPVIGFLAHVDTATDFTGKNVKPQLIEEYDGEDIVLNESLHVVLTPKDFPELTQYKGHSLITTDGTTLLGADNKAGISEIMTAMSYLIQHPEVPHGTIRVAFTPDEEIGRGPHKFDVAAFGATYAYTVDGGPLGELQYESFNAAAAKVIVKGTNVHPGSAKNKMVNSMKIAMELQAKLPAKAAPEYTEGYEGFFHLNSFEGDVEKSVLTYLVRDFDKEAFEERKTFLKQVIDELKSKFGEETLELELYDQYYNMGEKILPVREIVDIASDAMKNVGVEPVSKPIRGGTDGSQLSYMGLPTPNIFTGGENYHGKFEYASVNNMIKATEVIIEIARLFAVKNLMNETE
ncbi:peptidase T [Bacillus coahuilensis p1.1.43]|uniref:Peptidase T n=1 Tax=Bacillus coahuilensis p1.1.43 TaxID=1150625 RepID=A0A147KBE9_9BACI|nr:peptidase T [Bacillus coahuilensis]KUP08488.1 peptidase T [Bacillus coahuilensis p1.1.43]